MKFILYLTLGIFIGALLAGLITLSVLWSGFVLATLWGWFMVPALAVPALGVLQAAGISMVIKFMTFQFNYKEVFGEDEDAELKVGFDKYKRAASTIVFTFVYPLFALGTGWLIHLAM